MNAKEILGEYKAKIDKQIEEYFKLELVKSKNSSPYIEDLVTYLRDYTVRGGKRLRAALVYYSYLAFNKENTENIIKTSVFIELIQSYLLILDDIMDQDSLRRGFPTLHKELETYHKSKFTKGNAEHFGISMAINTACMASHKAIKILADSPFQEKLRMKAISLLQEQLDFVAQGQALDIIGGVVKEEKIEDVLLVHKLKTAVYTYETPILIGAILAGASEDDIRSLKEYSHPAGIAFQLQDDMIGMFGDEKEIGKNVGSDIKEGKSTILTVYAYGKANPQQKDTLDKILGNQTANLDDIKKVRKIVMDTGAYEYSKKLSIKYVKEAQEALNKLKGSNPEGLIFLEKICEYMINRTY